MGLNEEIAKAFGAHGAWKTRIAQAIDSGQSEYKPEEVAVDNRCAFGKWLHDPALTAEVRGSDDYRSVLDLHAEFHRAAGATMARALDGDRAGAHADLTGGGFARASGLLATAMVRWQRNAATDCIAGSVAAAVEEQDAATKEISRNVQHSAAAAHEVTQRIVAVANEAASTVQQAATVETQLVAMAGQVIELGHVLTRVVRTASPDVNRRSNPRYETQSKAKVRSAQGEFEGDLADISVGGARVTGISGQVAGHDCILAIDEVKVPVTVKEGGKGGVYRLQVNGGPNQDVARWIDKTVGKTSAGS
jgi:hypothetical protein